MSLRSGVRRLIWLNDVTDSCCVILNRLETYWETDSVYVRPASTSFPGPKAIRQSSKYLTASQIKTPKDEFPEVQEYANEWIGRIRRITAEDVEEPVYMSVPLPAPIRPEKAERSCPGVLQYCAVGLHSESTTSHWGSTVRHDERLHGGLSHH